MKTGDSVRIVKDGKRYGPYTISAVHVLPALPDQNARVSRVTVMVNDRPRAVPVEFVEGKG